MCNLRGPTDIGRRPMSIVFSSFARKFAAFARVSQRLHYGYMANMDMEAEPPLGTRTQFDESSSAASSVGRYRS